jgi:hypothetical protein
MVRSASRLRALWLVAFAVISSASRHVSRNSNHMHCSRIVPLFAVLALMTTAGAGNPTSAQGVDDPEMACDPDEETCSLEDSGPVVATRDGQVIEGLRIHAVDEPGILVNNSPWGVGVMFENSRHGLVARVDTVAQANGAFSAYPGHDITFRRTRARGNICGNQGRGRPRSKGAHLGRFTWFDRA